MNHSNPTMGKKLTPVVLGAVFALFISLLLVTQAAASPLDMADQDGDIHAVEVQTYVESFDVSTDTAEQDLSVQEQGADLPVVLQEEQDDDYAGLWFDSERGEFVVPVLGGEEGAPAAVDAVASTEVSPSDYRLERVNSSWQELEDVQKELEQGQRELLEDQLMMLSINVRTNAVAVTLAGEVTAAQREALEEDATNAQTDVEIKTAETPRFNFGNLTCISTRSCGSPLRGGVAIGGLEKGGESTEHRCTAGFKAVGNTYGNRFLLTAGHCNPDNEQWWSEDADIYNSLPKKIGTLEARNYPGGDWEAYNANGTIWDQPSWPNEIAVWGEDQDYAITAESGSYLGEIVCSSGMTSGSHCAPVTDINVSIAVEDGIEIHMVETGLTVAEGGDSGGPVFANHTALGLVSAGDLSLPATKTYMYYPEIVEATRDLGVHVATKTGAPPVASTYGDVVAGSDRQMTVYSELNPHGLASVFYYQYGTTTGYGNSTQAWNGAAGWGFEPVGGVIGGLHGSTAYHYRMVASNGVGTSFGEDEVFTTPAWKPTSVTSAPTVIEPHKVELLGSVDPEGGSTTYQIEWGPTTAYGSTVPVPAASIGSGTTPVAVSQAITGLKGSTTYHFRIVATNDEGTSYSADQPFTTPDWRPLVATKHASGITEEEATLEGKVNPQLRSTTYQFEYGETSSYGTTVPVSPVAVGAGNAFLNVSERIGGLKPETLYYYRIKATNEEGTSYSDVYTFETFTTKATPATFSLSFGGHGSGNGQLEEPRGIAADAAGNVWVADYGNDRVVELDPGGQFIRAIGVTGATNEKLNNPVDVAIDRSTGIVWVAEGKPSRLISFSPEGQFLSELSVPTNHPINSLTVAKGQRIIVSQYTAASCCHGWEPLLYLTEYAPGKSPVTIYSNYEWFTEGQLEGLTTNAAGDEVFAVQGTSLLKLKEASGKFGVTSYSVFGGMEEFGSAEGQVDGPGGITMRPSGNLLVADTGNHRVQQFSPTGEVLGAFRPEAAESEPAVIPLDIAVGLGGAEYVTLRNGSGNQVEKWLQAAAPEATTGVATEIEDAKATLGGAANAVGRSTTYRFEYGTTAAYGKSTSEGNVGIGFAPQGLGMAVTGLEPDTTYHYRIVATNKQGTAFGEDKTFTTKPPPPPAALPQMAVTDPLNSTVSPGSDFATWSALGWSSGGNSKGSLSSGGSGWYTPSSTSVYGAAHPTSATDTGAGVATVATMATGPSGTGNYVDLWLDMPTPTGAKAGYELHLTREAGSPAKYTASISKWQGGSETVLGSMPAQAIADGTTLALTDVGNRVGAWTSTGAGFTYLVGATDSTFSGGASGIAASGTTVALKNFKAGQIVAASNPTGTAIESLPLIDSFSTAEDPLSRGGTFLALQWANGTTGHNTGLAKEGGWLPYDSGSKLNGAYWKGTTFSDAGSGDGVTARVINGPESFTLHYFALWLDMPNPGAAKNGYQLRFQKTEGTYTVTLAKFYGGVETVLTSKTAYKILAGARIALIDKGSTVSVWSETGAGFFQLLSASDSTFSSGYVGIEGSGAVSRIGDLRGGAF